MKFKFEKITELRKAKGYSVTGLCNLIGISRSTLWSWKKGRKQPSENNIRQLAKILHIPISDIADLNNELAISDYQFKDVIDSWLSYTEINDSNHQEEINKVLSTIKGLNTKLNQSVVIIKALIESMKIIFYIKDSNLRFLTANKTFLENSNLPDDYHILDKTDSNFFSKAEAKTNYEQDKKVFQTGTPVLQKEAFIPGSRKKKWGIISKLPVFDSSKKIIGVIGTFIDITARKKAEENWKLVEMSLNSMAQIFMIYRWQDNSFIYTNKKAFEEISGYPVDIIYAKGGREFLLTNLAHTDDRYKLTIGDKLQHSWDETRDFIWRLIRPNNEIRQIESTQSFIELPDSTYTITVCRDITENPNRKTKLDDLFINIINNLSNENNVITWIIKKTNSKDIKAQYLSDPFEEVTGYKKSYFTGDINSLQQLLHPEYHRIIKRWIDNPKSHKNFIFKLISANSKIIKVRTSISTIKTHDIGKVYYGSLKLI